MNKQASLVIGFSLLFIAFCIMSIAANSFRHARDDAAKVLAEAEWEAGATQERCPICFAVKDGRHGVGCKLDQVLTTWEHSTGKDRRTYQQTPSNAAGAKAKELLNKYEQ